MRRENMTDLFPQFQQRLAAVGGECHYVENMAGAAASITGHEALAQKEIVIAPRFHEAQPWGALIPLLRDKGIRIREAGSAASVADAPAGLSAALLAVEETGSVLTLTHFVLVRAVDLVPMLDDIGAKLQQLTRAGEQQQHYISLVTGPSRTADIERTLTVGVQGPKALCVLVVNDQEAEL
jgi:L-lactate dehydrogenase complex protein LldG